MPISYRRIRNSQIRGSVFGLKQVSFEQSIAAVNQNIESTVSWSESDYYTYFAGGRGAAAPLPNSGTCNVYRLDLTNETFVAPPANQLGRAYWGMTGTAGNLYGYFMGGATPIVATVKRIDYLTDTVTTPATTCPHGYAAACVQDANYGFIGGGANAIDLTFGSGALGNVSKFDYSIDTLVDTGGVIGGNNPYLALEGNTRSHHGGASSRSYGYFLGGAGNTPVPTPTGPTPSSGQLYTHSRLDLKTGTSNIGDFGPSLQGGVGTSASQSNSYAFVSSFGGTARLDFYNDTGATTNLLPVLAGFRGVGSSNIFGYYVGGDLIAPDPTSSPVLTSRMDRLNFSNDVASVAGNFIGGALISVGSFSVGGRKLKITWQPQPSLGYGYNYGGNLPALSSLIDRLSFTNDTNVFISSRLPGTSTARNQGVASYPTGNYIYIAGGTPPITCNIVRHNFSDDSVTTISNKLPAARYGLAGVQSPTNAYFGGGYFTPVATWSCTIYKMSFSTETVTLPGSNLPTGLLESGAFQSPTSGFICGGQIPGAAPGQYSCTIHKITFSTDTISLPGKNMPVASSKHAAVQSATYGYLAGGEKTGRNPSFGVPFIPATFSTINKIDFATETVTAVTQSLPLPAGTRGSGGCTAPSYGYFCGGVTNTSPSASYLSYIFKMSFTTETNSSLPTKLTRNAFQGGSGSTVS